MFNFKFLLFIFFISPSISYSYFDPGTGAFIVQAILGFIAAIAASLTMTWTKIKMFFLKLIGKDKKVDKKKENK